MNSDIKWGNELFYLYDRVGINNDNWHRVDDPESLLVCWGGDEGLECKIMTSIEVYLN